MSKQTKYTLQEVTDARLEREWLDRIHKKYKVKVNKKVLKEVK